MTLLGSVSVPPLLAVWSEPKSLIAISRSVPAVPTTTYQSAWRAVSVPPAPVVHVAPWSVIVIWSDAVTLAMVTVAAVPPAV
jgi:hypothetical protein